VNLLPVLSFVSFDRDRARFSVDVLNRYMPKLINYAIRFIFSL
jgi:hypothetical protein